MIHYDRHDLREARFAFVSIGAVDLRLPALDIVLQVPNPGIDLAPLRHGNESLFIFILYESFILEIFPISFERNHRNLLHLHELHSKSALEVAILVRNCLDCGEILLGRALNHVRRGTPL